MPLVKVRYKNGIGHIVATLCDVLPEIVAKHLSVEGAERYQGLVKEKDVILNADKGSSMDKNTKDIQIVIFAHDFPKRVATKEQRKEGITNDVQTFLSNYPALKGSVWINLNPTSFGCF